MTQISVFANGSETGESRETSFDTHFVTRNLLVPRDHAVLMLRLISRYSRITSRKIRCHKF